MAKHRRTETVWGTDDLFGRLYYGFVPCEAAWRATVKRLCPYDQTYPTSHGHMLSFEDKIKGKRCCLVTIADRLDATCTSLEITGLLAHEALHVKQELMDVMGESAPSIEFEAHVLQSVFQDLLQGYCATRRNLLAAK